MISPEILRRFQFFTGLDDAQLKSLAMVAEEEIIEAGSILFKEGQPAINLFILLNGTIDLFIKSEELHQPATRRDFFAGEINPGEIFGISALLEPHIYTSTAIAAQSSAVVVFDASSLRSSMASNPGFGCQMMKQIAQALLLRLNTARIQLAAAWVHDR